MPILNHTRVLDDMVVGTRQVYGEKSKMEIFASGAKPVWSVFDYYIRMHDEAHLIP